MRKYGGTREVVQPESNMGRKTRRSLGGKPPGWTGKRLGQNTRIRRRR